MTGKTPARIQRKRTKGWHKPPDAIIVDRTSRWGNPFKVAEHGREAAIRLYEQWLLTDRPDLVARLPELRGRTLVCFCRPDEPCHGDVLLRLANREEVPRSLRERAGICRIPAGEEGSPDPSPQRA